jgi:HEXXH motif-containing protein
LVTECAPHYGGWIRRLLHTIVPLDAPKGHQIIASLTHRRGEVLMSCNVIPVEMEEMLVRELSHQHYFLASFLGPFDDGRD